MGTRDITVMECTCERCQYVWNAAAAELPKTCARCRSPYWNVPRRAAQPKPRKGKGKS